MSNLESRTMEKSSGLLLEYEEPEVQLLGDIAELTESDPPGFSRDLWCVYGS